MGELRLETKVEDVKVYRDPQERKGHVDVRAWLTRGLNEEGLEDVEAVITIRVYFRTEDVPLRELIDSSVHRARRALERSLSLWESDLEPEDPTELWFE